VYTARTGPNNGRVHGRDVGLHGCAVYMTVHMRVHGTYTAVYTVPYMKSYMSVRLVIKIGDLE